MSISFVVGAANAGVQANDLEPQAAAQQPS
jgi:hypothetical protein